jgi:hypothetical protein
MTIPAPALALASAPTARQHTSRGGLLESAGRHGAETHQAGQQGLLILAFNDRDSIANAAGAAQTRGPLPVPRHATSSSSMSLLGTYACTCARLNTTLPGGVFLLLVCCARESVATACLLTGAVQR